MTLRKEREKKGRETNSNEMAWPFCFLPFFLSLGNHSFWVGVVSFLFSF